VAVTNSAAWPQWEVHFDKDGQLQGGQQAGLSSQLGGADITDLIVISHGWQTTEDGARSLYQDWLGMLPPLLPDTSRIGTVGVFWPSMQWPDEPAPQAAAGGAAAGGAAGLEPTATSSDADDVLALTAVYQDPAQKDILAQLARLLADYPDDPAALDQFHQLMKQLAATEPEQLAAEDDGAAAMLTEDPRTLAMRFADGWTQVTSPGADDGGAAALPDQGGAADLPDQSGVLGDDADAAAGIGGVPRTLWKGAKEALRQLTYWMMKHRAGTVGQQGLAPYLSALMTDRPQLRIHLIGHSFGARLVSYVLPGLAPNQTIASLTLLEGAFSHYAFAPALPHDGSRSGALAGMNARVAGPIVVCYSSHDLAVGYFYPLASMAAHDDASGLSDFVVRWGGMGHDGAQAVPVSTANLGPVDASYPYTRGQFTNVDCSGIVRTGGPPAGAHSDIFHPELARVMLTASGLAS
jgi:hypothetical protein